ncbi:MAG: 50S ribosomal protein L23 [Candidatus Paceibacterota bacterium]|jgi:large subunit ribosomal protein L23
MALLKSTTKKVATAKVVKPAKTTKPAVIGATSTRAITSRYASVIRKPRVTEKAGMLSEKFNAYAFEIDNRATKDDVRDAVRDLYKVEAVKVNIIRLPAKKMFSRGTRGKTSAVKKAIVFLKKGDKIEFI